MYEAIERWLSGLESKTQECYRGIFNAFLRFFDSTYFDEKAEIILKNITHVEVVSYVNYLRSIKRADKTISNNFVALKSLFGHLCRLKLVEQNHAELASYCINTRRIRLVRPTPYLSRENLEKLVDMPSESTKTGIRDRALLGLVYGGGLRRSEAANLTLSQLSFNDLVVVKLPKNKSGKYQEQSLPNWAGQRLLKYAQIRVNEGCQENEKIFINYMNCEREKSTRNFCDDSILYMIKKYARMISEDLYVTVHGMRATAITDLLKDKVTLDDAARFARHASISTTLIYDKRVKGIYDNVGLQLGVGFK